MYINLLFICLNLISLLNRLPQKSFLFSELHIPIVYIFKENYIHKFTFKLHVIVYLKMIRHNVPDMVQNTMFLRRIKKKNYTVLQNQDCHPLL